jgi:hypothetical protein
MYIWQKGKRQEDKQVGEIEVDKQTRKTILRKILPKYQEIANYIEHIFKTTKRSSYPVEFAESLDKI